MQPCPSWSLLTGLCLGLHFFLEHLVINYLQTGLHPVAYLENLSSQEGTLGPQSLDA